MKRISLILITVLLLLAIPLITCAESETGYYVRLNCLNSNIGGDFDNGWYYTGEEDPDDIYIPIMDQGTGFGITIGGYRGRLSGEVSYFFSEHDSYFYDATSHYHDAKTNYDILTFDVKYAFLGKPAEKMSLYGLFGVGLPRFTVQNGSYNNDTSEWIDESLTGMSYSLGIGCSIRFNSKINLDIDYIVRRIDITGFNTTVANTKPTDDLRAIERTMTIGMSYGF